MNEEVLKSAFARVKEDISLLYHEISELKTIIQSLQEEISKLNSPLFSSNNPTIQQINPAYVQYSTDNSTVPQEIGGLNPSNSIVSTGNRGVSTNSQTIPQTDFQPNKPTNLIDLEGLGLNNNISIDTKIKQATEILNSLDVIKQGIKSKFKSLTPQEMAVFSLIYQLDEENPDSVDYAILANRLHLTQSSIRDYVQRIISKGISLNKEKINNKKILLSISPDLKKIVSLSTIIQLRAH